MKFWLKLSVFGFYAVASIVSIPDGARAATISTFIPPADARVSYDVFGFDGTVSNAQSNPPGSAGAAVQYISYNAQTAALVGGYPAGGVTAFALNNFANIAQASSSLTYYFTIQGPSSISVPVSITGKLLWQTNWSYENQNYLQVATARLSIDGNTASIGHCLGLDVSCASKAGVLSFSETSSFLTNTPIEVSLAASAVAFGPGSIASATADPVFTIDPAFLSANPGYNIVLSDGVGNSLLVTPLPSSLPMFASGLIGLVALGRRRLAASRLGS
jgi:hypothetical protein